MRSLIGRWDICRSAGWWEPDEPRGSRPVLREAGGEIPSAYSPESGLDGVYDRRRRSGPSPRLSAEQQAKVAAWIEQGADLERDGVVRWRCVDLQRRIMQEFAVQLHERTVGKLLRKLSFRRLSVRPQHPQSKPEEQAVFKAASLIL